MIYKNKIQSRTVAEPGSLFAKYAGLNLYYKTEKTKVGDDVLSKVYENTFIMFYEQNNLQPIPMGTIFKENCDSLEHLISYLQMKKEETLLFVKKQRELLPLQTNELAPSILKLRWDQVTRWENSIELFTKIINELKLLNS